MTKWLLLFLLWQMVQIGRGQFLYNETDEFLITGGYVPNRPQDYGKYLVSMRYNIDSYYFGKHHYCTGTIYASKWVLTAAHCVYDHNKGRPLLKANIRIVIGTIERTRSAPTTRIYKPDRILPHPNYSPFDVINDIGLVKTNHKMDLIGGFSAVVPINYKIPDAGTKCVAIGWGRMFHRGPMPNEALQTNLKLWNSTECALSDNVFKKDMMTCAGGLKHYYEDTCQGDSGGPLFCDGQQVGVVAYGFECGNGQASVFTHVPYFKDWISNNVKQ